MQEAREAATRIVEDANRAAEVIDRLRSFYTKVLRRNASWWM